MPRPDLFEVALTSNGSTNPDAFSPEPKAVPGCQPCFISSWRPMFDAGSGWGGAAASGNWVESEEAADGESFLGLGAPGVSSGELGNSARLFAERST
jgi:hypothetical protein